LRLRIAIISPASTRAWLDHRHFEPGLFRYRFDGPRIVFEISFAIEAEAVAFAEAFGGTQQGHEEPTAA
jgi:hypothetical protein